MKDYTHLTPKDKFDDSHIDELNTFSVDEIRVIVPRLLEWLQDGNWPISNKIQVYFEPRIHEIENELIQILTTNDEIWKYYILRLINNSGKLPGEKIKSEIYRIALHPKPSETEEELDQIAAEILKKFI